MSNDWGLINIPSALIRARRDAARLHAVAASGAGNLPRRTSKPGKPYVPASRDAAAPADCVGSGNGVGEPGTDSGRSHPSFAADSRPHELAAHSLIGVYHFLDRSNNRAHVQATLHLWRRWVKSWL